MRLTRGLRELVMALDFLAGAVRLWVAAYEIGLSEAAGLIALARARAWAARSCLREWRYELQKEGVL